MKKKGQLIVGLVILFPLMFFLSMAITTNQVALDAEKLTIEGAGGLEVPLNEIVKAELIDEMPEITNAGNFSLGLVKKGNFQRLNDSEVVRVIKNDDSPWIHLFTSKQEVYFNMSSAEDTELLFADIQSALGQGI